MVKQRSVGVCILLSLVTCGIYALYWFVCLTDDTNAVTGRVGPSGGCALLYTLVTCGIYGLYWNYKLGEALDNEALRRGRPTGSLSILFLVLSAFGLGLVGYAIAQSRINEYAQY